MADGSGTIKLDWGDGEQKFRLPMKQLRELQDKTGVGPEVLCWRIASGEWKVDDLRETIRLGLIGGGMDEVKAAKLVRQYFDDGPYLKHRPVAVQILHACLKGPEDDPVGKEGRGGQETQAGASPSPHSSEAPAPSA